MQSQSIQKTIAEEMFDIGPDRFRGLDVIDVIHLLHKRLNWVINVEEIDKKDSKKKRSLGNNWTVCKPVDSLRDDGTFAYAVLRKSEKISARYNPYNLLCVAARKAVKTNHFFTVTASGITQVISL